MKMDIHAKKPKRFLLTGLIGLLGFSCWPSIGNTDPEFQNFLKQHNEQFNSFLSKEDRAFADFLRKEWEDFQVFKGLVKDSAPKPADPPVISNIIQTRQHQPSVSPNEFYKRQHSTEQQQLPGFFGHLLEPVKLPVSGEKLPDFQGFKLNEQIADAYVTLASTPHQAVIEQIQRMQQQLNLDDWGTFELVRFIATQMEQTPHQQVYAWFLLNKLGYNLKVASADNNLLILMPSELRVYANRFTTINDITYYMLLPTDLADQSAAYERVLTYNDNSQPQGRLFDLRPGKIPAPSGHTRRLSIWPDPKASPIAFDFDVGTSDYLFKYPQLDLQWYFNVPPSPAAADSMAKALKPKLKGLSEREAINYLLKFTQRAFSYATDQQQFNREKYLTIEESLTFGINDCEDRSIFLAWLIKNLLQTEVVALDYPGHVALAVKTRPKPSDDIVAFEGQKFVVADPTYIGADLGMAMPSVSRLTPEIFSVN